jgi:Rrf2 family transcriptional regulator, iron-sulfur cluster assembly transcription factor
MQIHTKSRVAISALLHMAIHGGNGPVSLASISVRQRVSQSYLEHLFHKLRRSGFVIGFRGPGGGYQLNRSLATISVVDVINAVDANAGDQDSTATLLAAQRGESHTQVTDSLWTRVNDHLFEYLRTVSLESLLPDAEIAADSQPTSAVMPSGSYGERSPWQPADRIAAIV